MRTSKDKQRDLQVVRARLEELGWKECDVCDDWVTLARVDDGLFEMTTITISIDELLPTQYYVTKLHGKNLLANIPDNVRAILPEFRFCRFYWRTDLLDPLDNK